MNNFSTPTSSATSKIPRHLESLATTVFQSLFPPINPQKTPLKSIRRVLLLNREPTKEKAEDGSFILNFRHYAITTKATDISRPLRRLNAAEKLLANKTSRKGRVPNLGKLQDIADYMVGGENGEGYITDATSGSEVDTDAEVEVLGSVQKRVMSRKAAATSTANVEEAEADANVEKRAVKLVELGPRMRLRLVKVEEGMCSGKVMWHDYLQKSKEEIKALDARWEQRRREKDERRKQQNENVEKKRKEKQASGASKGAGGGDDDEDEDEDMDMYDYEFDSEGLEGDAELQVNERLEENGEWEDEEEEIANHR
jgi:ribosome biogenesis protein SSF1/2